ncbi:CG0192-related protein [Rhodococcus phenolicus]|uniref:CG0192-related protein n=1 Tax=Rhodococcus phenolicus TaxID=263849 RepID=UPI0008346D6E|nr:hypothetical protein [Rhodococcus phenolicus]
MALIHHAQLSPSKSEILATWVPTQPWSGGSAELERVDAYRFDDPDGEVGIETHLLRTADGRVLHVPLTYRGAPLGGAEDSLVATMDHSVLGTRWVYDACADPVYVATLVTAIATGGGAADLVDAETGKATQGSVKVSGSGTPDSPVPTIGRIAHTSDATTTTVSAGGVGIVLMRVIDTSAGLPEGAGVLTGTWPGQGSPTLLAVLRPGVGRVKS